ncbi:hypothetical protein BDR26DRAFT_940900 [Obelidium mucronatum]|nr:hypothetical protein BDR26DRAFT_940900 [Obelidium mucronatum]
MESDFGGGRRDDKQRETIEQILSKVKDATFGFMFNVSRQTSGDTPIFFHYLELIIELFQNMAFPILFTWAPWTPDIQWFRDFISYLTPWQYFLQSQEAYYSMLGILGILFITSATIAYASTQHKIRFAGPIKLLRLLLLAISGPLYLPMFGLMIFTALDCNDPHYDSIDCHSGLFIVRAIGTFLMGLLYMMLSLQVRVACFEFEPKAKDLTCRPHSRLDIVYILFRTILVVTALVLILYGGGPRGDESMPNWIMCIMCLVFSGILAYGHIWYIPYYNYRYSQLRAGIFLNFFWASLCYLYTNILHDSDIGIILVIGIPVVFVLAAFLVHSRRRMIEEMPKNGITDPLILELKARFILIRENLLYPSSQAEALSRNGKSPGDIGYVAPKANSGPDESRAAKEASVYAEINSMYVQGVKDMSKSCMLQIMIGTFQIVYLKNRAQCLAVTTKAAGLRPHPDEAFMIFKRHRDLNERAIGSDGVDFIAFERHLATAKKNERKATISIVQFWAELMKRHPSIHKLETYGSAITSAITAARGSYLTLIKLSPNSPNVYRMYGAFLINVINDAKKGQELIDHAEEIEEEAQRETGFRNELDDDGVPGVAEEMSMFSEDNGLITISGEKSNMCQVIHANPAFLKLFGFKKHELVGENINKIIPNPFCTIHDVLVSRYVETGFAKVIDRVRQVLGLNGDGYLFVFILCVKHIVDPEGKQSFVGVVKPGPSRPNAGNVIMNDGFTILHASENVCRLLGIRPRQTMDFNIRDIFPKINHDVLTSKAGMKGVLTSGGEKFEIEWFGDALPLNGSNCYICRVKFNASGEGIGSRSSISAEDKPMVFSPHGSEHDLRQTKSISIQSSQMSQQIYGRKASTSSAGGCPFMPADRRVSMAPALPPIPTNASLTRRLSSAKAADIPLPKKNVVRRSSSGSRTNLKNKYETQLRITVARKNAQVTGNLMALHTLFQALFAILILYLQIATNVSDSRAIVKAKFQTLKKNRINILNLYGTLVTIGSPVRNKNRTIDAMEVIFGLNTLSDYAAVASPQDLIYDFKNEVHIDKWANLGH